MIVITKALMPIHLNNSCYYSNFIIGHITGTCVCVCIQLKRNGDHSIVPEYTHLLCT